MPPAPEPGPQPVAPASPLSPLGQFPGIEPGIFPAVGYLIPASGPPATPENSGLLITTIDRIIHGQPGGAEPSALRVTG